jgi:hypothetical protein
MHFFLQLAAAAPPARGAALDQVAGVSAAVTLFTAALLWLGLGHRSGRVTVLDRASRALGRLTGLPRWAALPLAVSGGSLLLAVVGLYWDVSLHIDQGRDPGPLANPAHYFILVGLYGIFAAGWLAIALPGGERPGPAAVRIADGWEAPVGGLLMAACASFALIGFPLDDVSHRLFGQDVTLWGPTHLMMLGGAALTLVAALVLLAEARLALRLRPPEQRRAETPTAARLRRTRVIGTCGGMLAGLSIFQGEFDYGVPQFSLLFHPLLIAFAAALALVLARTLIGRGGALAAVAFFLVLRGALALLVGGAFGETVPHFPPYIAEALLVEALALRVKPGGFRLGALAGVLIATLGVLAEYAWSHVWMPLPWPGRILPEAIALALPVAVAGGVLGAFVAGGLRLDRALVGRPRAWAAAGASLLTVAAVVAFLLPSTAPTGARAQIALRTLHAGRDRTVAATIRFDPPSAVAHASWLTMTAWQGGGRLVVDRLRPLGGGVYATTRPIPVGGNWKAMIRLDRGRDLAAIPVALPADAAIPVGAVPPLASATRAFQRDQRVLQRERRLDVPGWLWGVAGLVVLGITSALLLVLGWGLVRLARRGSRAAPEAAPPAPPAERTASSAPALALHG